MKRTGQLFDAILARDNLRLGVAKALRGKRHHRDVQSWTGQLDANLERMAKQLRASTFPVGRFHQFVIRDPKERIITAPSFEERVLHHAVMNVCEPYLDRWLINDTYACRKGKGRLVALRRTRRFAARYRFFLKMDIRKYFDSIAHDRLLERLERRFKDERLLKLFASIIRSYRGCLGRGVPIGSLTSQHFANFYLGWHDRFAKEQLRMPGYVRYMDDIAIWSDDASRLNDVEQACRHFLREELDLEVKAHPYRNRTTHGMDYLGCRVYDSHMVLNRRSRVRFRRKLTNLESLYSKETIDSDELQHRAEALIAFTRTPGLSAWQYRQKVLGKLTVSGQEARTG